MKARVGIASALFCLLATGAYAEINGKTSLELPFLNITAPNQVSGVTFVSPIISGSADSSNIPFSTSTIGNPLGQVVFKDIPVASVNAGYTLLSGTAGETIYPGNFTLVVSGTAAGATSVNIFCQDTAKTDIANFAIATLINNSPVDAFTSAGNSNPTRGKALTAGCPLGSGIIISTGGSALTTTTDVYVQLPYVAVAR